MKKVRDANAAGILYLASVLPMLKERSNEAAALVEAAILECILSLSGSGSASALDDAELEAFLHHALDDIGAISPLGGGLLRRAIGLLRETRRESVAQPTVLH